MGLKNDIDPWERIKQLEAQLDEVTKENQAAHNALDAAGADEGHAIKEITEGEQLVNYSLDARIIRYLIEHACPLGKIRR